MQRLALYPMTSSEAIATRCATFSNCFLSRLNVAKIIGGGDLLAVHY